MAGTGHGIRNKCIYPIPTPDENMHGRCLCTIILALLLVLAGCVSTPQEKPAQPFAPAGPEARPHYIVGADGDFPPFTMSDQNGTISGFDADAARWVAEHEGFDITFVAVPWDTIVPSLESRRIDIIWSGMTITDTRREQVNFSEPYFRVSPAFAIRNGSPFTMQDLYAGRLRVGAQAGSTGADWITDNLVKPGRMPGTNLTLYPDISSLSDRVADGTVDISIVQDPSQQRVTASRSLVIIGSAPHQELYAVAVRKDDPELLARINEGLSRLKKDPYWQELQKKYGLTG